MLSTTLTSHPFPLHKTNDSRRRRRSYSVKSRQPIDKSHTSRKVLTGISLPAAKRVVLVRHGQSTWNAEGRIQGSSDFSVLTPKGESQAETSRQMLIQDSFDVCFSSPLARSKRTAEIVWDDRAEEIVTDSNLREIDLYSFQGLLKNEGKAKHGEAYRQWQTDASNFIIDGHYPVRELWSRARSCWTKILNHESSSILVVAHNAVNQALVATALGLGTDYFRVLLQSNCGVSVLEFTPNPERGFPEICLNRLNQTPSSPLDASSSGGRKSGARIILVSPQNEISVQEAADNWLMETRQLSDLDVENIIKNSKQGKTPHFQSGWLNLYEDEVKAKLWDESGLGWKRLLGLLSTGLETENNVVAVGHPALHIAMVGHCLNLTKEWLGSFHVDAGGISVVEFPDGPTGRGVIRCINYHSDF